MNIRKEKILLNAVNNFLRGYIILEPNHQPSMNVYDNSVQTFIHNLNLNNNKFKIAALIGLTLIRSTFTIPTYVDLYRTRSFISLPTLFFLELYSACMLMLYASRLDNALMNIDERRRSRAAMRMWVTECTDMLRNALNTFRASTRNFANNTYNFWARRAVVVEFEFHRDEDEHYRFTR